MAYEVFTVTTGEFHPLKNVTCDVVVGVWNIGRSEWKAIKVYSASESGEPVPIGRGLRPAESKALDEALFSELPKRVAARVASGGAKALKEALGIDD